MDTRRTLEELADESGPSGTEARFLLKLKGLAGKMKLRGPRDPGPPLKRVAVDMLDSPPPKHQMLPVWFFIGIVLIVYGLMILAQGIYELSHPVGTVLENLHAAIWWGALMAVTGLIFVQTNRPPA